MGFVESAVLGAGLSMDSFAVSVVNGMCKVRKRVLAALLCALCYGLFQGSLTCIGYAAGAAFAQKLRSIDHFVAFGLLCLVGGKMMYESKKEDTQTAGKLSAAAVFLSAFATSLDALTVGVSLGALDVSIVFVGAVIALVSAVICFAGFLIGSKAGKHLGSTARAVGGIVLIMLGFRILAQHLGLFGLS